MTKLYLSLLALVCAVLLNNANAQIIELGPELKKKIEIDQYLGEADGTSILKGRLMRGTNVYSDQLWAVLDENMNLKTMKIKIKYAEEKHKLESVQVFDGKVYAFTSVFNQITAKNSFYYGSLDKNTLELEGDMTLITAIESKKKNNSGRIEFRKDEEHLMVFVHSAYEKEVQATIHLLVFEKGLGLPKAHSFESPLPLGSEMAQVILKDKLYIQSKKYLRFIRDSELKPLGSGKSMYGWQIHSIDLESYQVTAFDYDVDEDMVGSHKFVVDDEGRLNVAGFYSNSDEIGTKGMFYFRMAIEDEEVKVIKTKEPFSKDFILSVYPEKEHEKILNKDLKNGDDIQMPKCLVDSLMLNNQGLVILVGEMYYKESARSDTYIHGDIIVSAINPQGEVVWVSGVPKKRFTSRAGKSHLSYAMFVTENELHFFYADRISNLEIEASGEFNTSGKDYCVVKAKVLSDGSVTREELKGVPETLLRTQCYQQLQENELLLLFGSYTVQQFVKLVY